MFKRYFIAALLLISGSAAAHSIGKPVNLPLPPGYYQLGAAAALVISFALIAYFMTSASAPVARIISQHPIINAIRSIRLIPIARALSLIGLLLCISTGYWGHVNSYDEFNLLWFWVGFVLLFTYITALVGNVYALINPWRTIVGLAAKVIPTFEHGLLRYPKFLAYWPAVLLYVAFVWQELLGKNSPEILSNMLIGYTLYNLAGSLLFGRKDWFKHCEFFTVFLSMIALLSPFRIREDNQPLAIRTIGSGITENRAFALSLLVFILFMLASTVLDGMHTTVSWHNEYKSYVTTNIDESILRGIRAFPKRHYDTNALMILTGLYIAAYFVSIFISWLLGGCRSNPYTLALRFAPTLVPIALVYHFSHYFTLIFTEGYRLIGQTSDPFAVGWNIFGTRGEYKKGLIPDAQWVWRIQVATILLGHVLSVYFAHILALRIYKNRWLALLSQLPMLLLMVIFTVFGLWVLSLEMMA